MKSDLTLICEKITRLAETGGEFTADDVREMLPNIETKYLGQAFRITHRNKTIKLVEYRNSQTPGRNGNTIKVWTGDWPAKTKHYG